MKYHGKERDKSSRYRVLGNRLSRAVQWTTFHFLGINTVGEMGLTMQQGTIQCILDTLHKYTQTFYTYSTHCGQTHLDMLTVQLLML